MFQSRNRVWAGSRLILRQRHERLRRRFNLAIEFGPVHAFAHHIFCGQMQWFQSRNRVWAGSRDERYAPHSIRFVGFNLAIEFGPVHARGCPFCNGTGTKVSISQSSLGRFTLDGSPGELRPFAVSISQSSLGRFTLCTQCKLRCFNMSFNLAIEFGPVHAPAAGVQLSLVRQFQSRNRVWAGSRPAPQSPARRG